MLVLSAIYIIWKKELNKPFPHLFIREIQPIQFKLLVYTLYRQVTTLKPSRRISKKIRYRSLPQSLPLREIQRVLNSPSKGDTEGPSTHQRNLSKKNMPRRGILNIHSIGATSTYFIDCMKQM